MEDISKCTLEQNLEFYAIPQNLEIGFKVYVELTLLDKNRNILAKKIPNNVFVEVNLDKEEYGNSKNIIIYKFVVKELAKELNINLRDISYVTGWIDANNDKQVSIDYDEVSVLEVVRCYCLEQGILNKSCNGNGNDIKDEHYKKLSEELGVEKEVLQAVGEVETGSIGSFQRENPKHASILYERHIFRNFIKEANSKKESSLKLIDELKNKSSEYLHNKYPDLIGTFGNHGKSINKLKEAKKLNESFAIQSCSWGKFQVMGMNYKPLYKTPQELEKAQNQCELQHLAYFKNYLKNKRGMVQAMKDKNWNEIARLYNGDEYKKNNYHIKMANSYNKFKGIK